MEKCEDGRVQVNVGSWRDDDSASESGKQPEKQTVRIEPPEGLGCTPPPPSTPPYGKAWAVSCERGTPVQVAGSWQEGREYVHGIAGSAGWRGKGGWARGEVVVVTRSDGSRSPSLPGSLASVEGTRVVGACGGGALAHQPPATVAN